MSSRCAGVNSFQVGNDAVWDDASVKEAITLARVM